MVPFYANAKPSLTLTLSRRERGYLPLATIVAIGKESSLSLWERVRVRDGLPIALKACVR